jgi:DNA-3-methyladenine glycosylase II
VKSKIIKIPKPTLFDFGETLWFLDRNLDDCMHRVEGKHVRKLIAFNNEPVLIEVKENAMNLEVEILNDAKVTNQFIADYIEEWFDLERDIRPFYRWMKQDADLAPLVKKYKGFRIVGIPDLFECLCWCVIGQQINLAFAYRLKRRLVEKYGRKIVHEGREWHLFPEPEVMAPLNFEVLRAMQFTGKKAEYIIGIAKLFAAGELSKEKLMQLGDEKRMLEELIKIRGIGEWTANYTLMKSIRAMNCVPYGDIGVNNALHLLKGTPKKNNRVEVDKVFSAFEGWKTYLVFYLWRMLR